MPSCDAAFFAISGYLITMSRGDRSRSLVDLFVKRVVRISPAFLVAQLVTAVFADQQLWAPVYVVVCIAVTVPLAAASWFAVERPGLRLKSAARGRGAPERAVA